MALASRNDASTLALIAKFTFCGTSPATLATHAASSLMTTTPMTLPAESSSGPPLLPACTGAVICKRRVSPRIPERLLTLPVVMLIPDRSPLKGNPATVADSYTALSLRLQEAFGLRREESIKLRPTWADRGDVLHLKASWTKGGKERDIPIRTEAQRELLQEAKQLAGAGSLIPAEMSYRDQLNRFKAQTARAGIDRVHGLRHHYAQARYAELTGWKVPAAGGPAGKQLSAERKVIDRQARLTISHELGHEREQITAVYLGR